MNTASPVRRSARLAAKAQSDATPVRCSARLEAKKTTQSQRQNVGQSQPPTQTQSLSESDRRLQLQKTTLRWLLNKIDYFEHLWDSLESSDDLLQQATIIRKNIGRTMYIIRNVPIPYDVATRLHKISTILLTCINSYEQEQNNNA
jgi:hypothetical protein